MHPLYTINQRNMCASRVHTYISELDLQDPAESQFIKTHIKSSLNKIQAFS